MKLEDQLTNLELSKAIEKVGVKQESLWSWVDSLGTPVVELEGESSYSFICSAFTVAELGEMLPEDSCYSYRQSGGSKWKCKDYNSDCDGWEDDTEANVRAKMLLHLIEKGIIKLKEVKHGKA